MKYNITSLALGLGLCLGFSMNGCATLQAQQSTKPSVLPVEQPTQTERDRYTAIDLKQLANRTSLTGRDPRAIALAAFGIQEDTKEAPVKQTVTVESITPTQTRVTITQMGLHDDSVRGRRYRVEFEANGTSEQRRWQMVWAGRQQTCWENRGSQEWSAAPCI